MTIKYEWNIPALDSKPKHVVIDSNEKEHELKGVVTCIHWILRAIDSTDELWAEICGTQQIDIEEIDLNAYVGYQELKTDKPALIAMLEEAMGQADIKSNREAVVARIIKKREEAKPADERDLDSTQENVNL